MVSAIIADVTKNLILRNVSYKQNVKPLATPLAEESVKVNVNEKANNMLSEVSKKVDEYENAIKAEHEKAINNGFMGHDSAITVVTEIEDLNQNIRTFLRSKKESYEQEILILERELPSKERSLKEIDKLIMSDWFQKGRSILGRAEAENALIEWEKENKFKKVDLLFYALFFAEFAYGAHIYKTFIAPDDTVQNWISAIVVGAMTLLIGFFVKYLPDAQVDLKKYNLIKNVSNTIAIVSMVTFIILLVKMREVNPTLDLNLNTDAPKNIEENLSEFLFNLSLLCTIIFGNSFFAHWNKTSPKKLIKLKKEEANELLNAYASDHYGFLKTQNEINSAISRRDNVLRPAVNDLTQKLVVLSQQRLFQQARKGFTKFIDGAREGTATQIKLDNIAKAELMLKDYKGPIYE